MVTHPSIEWAHSCLTSVIGPWMVTPCQHGSLVEWLVLVEWFAPVVSALLGPLGGISRRGVLSLLALLHWSFLASQVFMTHQDPGKLLCSDLEEFTGFFCHTHLEILPLEL